MMLAFRLKREADWIGNPFDMELVEVLKMLDRVNYLKAEAGGANDADLAALMERWL